MKRGRPQTVSTIRNMTDEEFTSRVLGQPLSQMAQRYTLGENTFFSATRGTRRGYVVTGRVIEPATIEGFNEELGAFIVDRQAIQVPTRPQRAVKAETPVETAEPAEVKEFEEAQEIEEKSVFTQEDDDIFAKLFDEEKQNA
jgi:hypothetical protein